MGNNLFLFVIYEFYKEDWDKKFGLFWVDKILVSDFDVYCEISEKEVI